MTVLDFEKEKLKGKPHLAGDIRCNACKHEWRGTAPLREPDGIKCPECGLYRGSFMANIDAEQGDIILRCQCGCSSYFIKICRGGIPKVLCHGCGDFKGEFIEYIEQDV